MIGSLCLCGRHGFLPALIANPQQCSCRQFRFEPYGDYLQTCQHQSAALPTHEWLVYRLSLMLRSVGRRVKIHKVAPAVGNERGDAEIKDYVVLPRGEDNPLPPHPLMLDVTMTHDRYGRTTLHTNGSLTHRFSSNGTPQPDGALKNAARKKILHYLQLYADQIR